MLFGLYVLAEIFLGEIVGINYGGAQPAGLGPQTYLITFPGGKTQHRETKNQSISP